MNPTTHQPLDEDGKVDLLVRIAAVRVMHGDINAALRLLEQAASIKPVTA